jgi:glycosyltransferase involved in cell wall biosynthesis
MENKRLDVLINAVKRLPMAIKKRVNLTIAGECTTPDFYYNLIGEESCISAYFRRIADEEVPELFFKHKYLVLPYEEVAQSGPHMIAYNYNLPVIASSIKGFTERIKDGETGFLFNVNDVASLANVIVKVADLSSDEYVLLKENLCRYTEEEYDLKKIACRYETFFDFVAKQY